MAITEVLKDICVFCKSVDLYWKKLVDHSWIEFQSDWHIDPKEGERKTYSLEELQSYVRKQQKKSRAIGTSFRDLTVQICDMIPVYYERLRVAVRMAWSERRRYDLYKIWINHCIPLVTVQKSIRQNTWIKRCLMGDFAFPNLNKVFGVEQLDFSLV